MGMFTTKEATIVAAIVALSASASAQMSRFQGNWDNIDPAAGGIARVIIDGSKIHLFGRCEPKPCDLGVVKATPIFSLRDKAVTALQAAKNGQLGTTYIDIFPEGIDLLKVTTRTQPQVPGQQRALIKAGLFRRKW